MEGVAGEDDPRTERDVVAGQAEQVAGPVPMLMAGDDDRRAPASPGTGSMIRAPNSGWRRMTVHSSSVSGPGLPRIDAGSRSCRRRAGPPQRRHRAVRCASSSCADLGHPDERLGVVAGVLVLRLRRVRERRIVARNASSSSSTSERLSIASSAWSAIPSSIRSSRELGGPTATALDDERRAVAGRSPIGTRV
jgi:hypothetical protein